MTEASISFDRAADFYDATRALPPDVGKRLFDAIAAEARRAGAEHILELGIGTGRIARPLAARGLRVTGVDISTRMLARLQARAEPGSAIDPLIGDVTHLPVASGAFRAALTVHVLHLIPDWETALAETARALAPGGALLSYHETYISESKWGKRSMAKWSELLAARGFRPRHRPSEEEIASALRRLGASLRTLEVADGVDRNTPATILEQTRNRIHSWTWEIPEELFFECLPEYESWLRREFDMDRELGDRIIHELKVWRFP
jgi:ubiquinone/menaquinone biosynthesis C-methylase UbiE